MSFGIECYPNAARGFCALADMWQDRWQRNGVGVWPWCGIGSETTPTRPRHRTAERRDRRSQIVQLRKIGLGYLFSYITPAGFHFFPDFEHFSPQKRLKTCDLSGLFPSRFTSPLWHFLIWTPIAFSSQRQVDTQPALPCPLRHPDREGFRTRYSRDNTQKRPRKQIFGASNRHLSPLFCVDTAFPRLCLSSSVFAFDTGSCRSRCILELARLCFLRHRSA